MRRVCLCVCVGFQLRAANSLLSKLDRFQSRTSKFKSLFIAGAMKSYKTVICRDRRHTHIKLGDGGRAILSNYTGRAHNGWARILMWIYGCVGRSVPRNGYVLRETWVQRRRRIVNLFQIQQLYNIKQDLHVYFTHTLLVHRCTYILGSLYMSNQPPFVNWWAVCIYSHKFRAQTFVIIQLYISNWVYVV